MTPSEISGVCSGRDALNTLDAITTDLVAQINARMNLAWSGDATHEAAFFETLGNRAADAWRKNGTLINAALEMGADYATIRKPDTVCIVCADGFVVPSGVPFPAAPLAVWHVPLATKAEAEALITQGSVAILAALTAAQPEA